MKYLVLLALMLPFSLMAEDTLIDLSTGDTVLATCTGSGGECPECPNPGVDHYATHGGSHIVAANLGTIDCRTCHGSDLRGTSRSVTSKPRGCIAPDGFYPPAGNSDEFTIDPYGIKFNPAGTSAALFSTGVIVGCDNCHDEAEFKYNGEKIEVEFKDRPEYDEDDD